VHIIEFSRSYRKLEQLIYLICNPCRTISLPHSCALAALRFLVYSPGFNVVCCPRLVWKWWKSGNPRVSDGYIKIWVWMNTYENPSYFDVNKKGVLLVLTHCHMFRSLGLWSNLHFFGGPALWMMWIRLDLTWSRWYGCQTSSNEVTKSSGVVICLNFAGNLLLANPDGAVLVPL